MYKQHSPRKQTCQPGSRGVRFFHLLLTILALAAVLSIVLVAAACAKPGPLPAKTPSAIPQPALPDTAVPTSTPSLTPVKAPVETAAPPLVAATRAPTITLSPTANPSGCSINPDTAGILQATTAEQWLEWVKKLSGAEPVTVGGKQVTFHTRYTPAMFGAPGPNAFDFLLQTVGGWYPEDQISVQNYQATTQDQRTIRGKNLILTIPGTAKKDEVVILSAHLDSISLETPAKTAPGAEDNAAGSAALLEAARLFRGHTFERTLRIIWFTGEEEGLLGSKAYVKELKNPREIQGVVNLDMFGYDSDNDRCFEMHVGSLPASDRIGQCFVDSIAAYQLGLPQPDYLIKGATSLSDHGSFWAAGVGAVEILENMFDQELPAGCQASDKNGMYHTPQDTYDRLNPDSAIRIVRAALATAAGLAGPVEPSP